jgi:hypothetical protein
MTKPDVSGSEAVQQAYVTARGMNPNDNGMQVDGMVPAGWNAFAAGLARVRGQEPAARMAEVLLSDD